MDGFWSLPLAAVVALLLAAMVVAHELGMRVHDRLHAGAQVEEGVSSEEGFILSGVLGLLALLMAFSFSMALNRLEDRRDLMLEEASAVGYLHVLAEGLSPEQARALQADLAAYGKARLAAAEIADGPARLAAETQAAALREPLAAAVRKALAQSPAGPLPVALAGAYDTLEDTAVRRQALAQAHLPARVLWLLAIFAGISAGMLGYALADSRGRHRAAATTFYLLVSLAFGVMLDLDRPTVGGIVVDQTPFAEAVNALALPAAPQP